MRRDTAINFLVGALLVLAFAAICLACAVPILLAIGALRSLAGFLLPAASRIDIEIFCFLSLALLVVCLKQIRKRIWPNVFLSVLAIPTIMLPYLLNFRTHYVSPDTVTALLIVLLPEDTRVSRVEFISWAAILAASFAANVGLLGSGVLSRIVEFSLGMLVLGWVVIKIRDRRYGTGSTFLSPKNS